MRKPVLRFFSTKALQNARGGVNILICVEML
jgi:hypothetical protein